MSDKSGFQVDENAPRYYASHVKRFMARVCSRTRRLSCKTRRCGTRCGLWYWFRRAGSVGCDRRMIGSDFNSEMIAMARSLSSGEGSNISWQQESALNLPFADNEFDAVISQQGIQFFPGSAAGLREMARVTKPGGRLAATVWAALSR
jgi:SAM-dependent methyltransferase